MIPLMVRAPDPEDRAARRLMIRIAFFMFFDFK